MIYGTPDQLKQAVENRIAELDDSVVTSATNTCNVPTGVETLDEDKEQIVGSEYGVRDDLYIDDLIADVESKFPESVDGATWEYTEDGMYLTISVNEADQLLELTIPYDDLTMKNMTADTNTILMAIEESVDKATSRYKYIKSKTVPDSNGFMTDYTMYYDTENDRYVFVFGDNELYRPEDEDFDWEVETREQADDWFDNYHGFEDEDDVDSDDYLNDRW